jgi:hypothetical protein
MTAFLLIVLPGSAIPAFVMPDQVSRFFDIEAAVSKDEDDDSEYDTDDLGTLCALFFMTRRG